MAVPVLIIGKSGSGKSTSLRNCTDGSFNLIRVLDKPLPFQGKVPGWFSDDYSEIMKCLIASKAGSIVIDDAGYLITNQFMKNHSICGRGNAVYELYNSIGDHFWNLIQFVVKSVSKDKIVYFMMHEDKDDAGEVKPKTIGRLLDEKVCVEGMFTIVLRAVKDNGKYQFVTQSSDGAVSKSPMGMFDNLTIDNDLKAVDQVIRDYYGMGGKEENE